MIKNHQNEIIENSQDKTTENHQNELTENYQDKATKNHQYEATKNYPDEIIENKALVVEKMRLIQDEVIALLQY